MFKCTFCVLLYTFVIFMHICSMNITFDKYRSPDSHLILIHFDPEWIILTLYGSTFYSLTGIDGTAL